MLYRERTYRNLISSEGLVVFRVVLAQSDLLISADRDLTAEATGSLAIQRHHIEVQIRTHHEFLSSLHPINIDRYPANIVGKMLTCSSRVGVGPMAGVAGAIAEYVGEDLLRFSQNVIVENGGDIFIKAEKHIKIGIFAGKSPLSNKVSLLFEPALMPLGVCTSSGTVGESLSYGKADAVCVISESATLADCAATAIGNIVKTTADIAKGIKLAKRIQGVRGCLIIVGEKMGCWGQIQLC